VGTGAVAAVAAWCAFTAFASASSADHVRPTAGRDAAHLSAVTLTVCRSGCAFNQIAPAVAGAKNGDTVKVAAGAYAGGFTIDTSIKLVGAGARTTIIHGGGPGVTVGVFGAPREPAVLIDGVTITGGITRSSPESKPMTGTGGVIAAGGGVEISPGATVATPGATVTISNSAITDNRVAPRSAEPSGLVCPSGPCPFAQAAGGGIDNSGTLTLINTTISGNRVGSASGLSTAASDADGAAIINRLAALTIVKSTITGNKASATAPNGRFADSGAIDAVKGAVTIRNSSVTHNSATLAAALPDSVNAAAIGGGIHIESGASATITNTKISDNLVSMTNNLGGATAFSGGLHTDGVLTLNNDVIADNSVFSATLPPSTGDAEGDSAAGEMGGTINNTRMTGNTVTVRSVAGTATALAGASIVGGTLTDSIVSDNHVFGSSLTGNVVLAGGGLQAGGPLTLQNTTVSANTGHASGLSGSAQGGGISDVDLSGIGQPPGGPLILTNSRVLLNLLSGSTAITLQGGGIAATNNPVTLTNSVIAGNSPDQCDGC
jgi:hypothetical protein